MTPKLADYLPELTQFLHQITEDVKSQKITSWQEFKIPCNNFYTPSIMQKIDSVAIGWLKMAEPLDRQTLFHVSSVFVALYLRDEYKLANQAQRSQMEWAVLFHDISKIPVRGGHDYVHGFKSAAVAGKALTKLNFPINEDVTESTIDTWYDLTYNATIYSDQHNASIQDMSKLDQIMSGLRHIHGEDAYNIVLTILLHIAIELNSDYPILAPISEENIQKYITPESFPIIKAMMLADGGGWELFTDDHALLEQRELDAQKAFARISKLIETNTL